MEDTGLNDKWVFISHSNKDFYKVRLIRNALENKGFMPILFYLKSISDDDEICDLIKREIDARNRFILCDSIYSRLSRYVQTEVQYIYSKNRMFEIINLTKIDINSENIDSEIMSLIKPFLRRTTIYLCHNHNKPSSITRLAIEKLKRLGFDIWNFSFYEPIPVTSACYRDDCDYLERMSIQETLKNGYVLFIFDGIDDNYIIKEFEYGFQIDPQFSIPIVFSNSVSSTYIQYLSNKNLINANFVDREEDKAQYVVNAILQHDINVHQ